MGYNGKFVPMPRGNSTRTAFKKAPKAAVKLATKKAYKPAGAKTKTKIKAKVTKDAEIHSGLSSETVKLSLGGKSKKISGGVIGRWNYMQTNNATINSSAGLQGVTTFNACGTLSQFLTDTGASYNGAQAHKGYYNMDPNSSNTGSAVLGSTVSPLESTINILEYKNSFEFTNLSQTGCFVDLYCITPKTYTNNNPDISWAAGYTNEAFGLPVSVPDTAGFSTNGTAGTMIVTEVGTTPFDSPLFKKQFKVLKVNKYNLAGGATQNVNYVINVGKPVKRDLIQNQLTAGNVSKPNLTVYWMFVTRGQIVDDTSAAGSRMTFGSTKLGCVSVTKVKMCSVKNPAGKLNTNYVSYQVPANAALGVQNIMNDVDVTITLTQA